MRILVVEDDKKVASFIEQGLREDGYSVDVAHDGVDGSMKAHVYDYDLVILDVMLPGKTGYEVLGGGPCDLLHLAGGVPVQGRRGWWN